MILSNIIYLFVCLFFYNSGISFFGELFLLLKTSSDENTQKKLAHG